MTDKPWQEIEACRICGNEQLAPVLSLGTQALTGVFPRTVEEPITAGPIDLVRCEVAPGREACGLVQLRQSYDKREMYGPRYGYRSSLNPSMVEHLHSKVRALVERVSLSSGDLVVDIGSNDGTLLRGYERKDVALVGVDPTGLQGASNYPPPMRLIPDFFSADLLLDEFSGRKAKIVTSIAMFYDLDSPLDFMMQIGRILADDGVWAMEQSYLPAMLKTTGYDVICHEHLEYYAVHQIDWMARRTGLKIVEVEENTVNGGSFALLLAKAGSARRPADIGEWLSRERHLTEPPTYERFERQVEAHRRDLLRFLAEARRRGDVVLGYGASTKGNVILQYCGLTARDIPCIGEVNADKFGAFTPGTGIPIVPEAEVKARRPAYLLVLPWHFRDFIVKKEAAYVRSGGRLLFPLPTLETEP